MQFSPTLRVPSCTELTNTVMIWWKEFPTRKWNHTNFSRRDTLKAMKLPVAMEMFGWSQKLWHLWSMNYTVGDHRLWWQWWHFILCLRMSSRVCFTYELWYNIFTMHASYCNIAIFNENFNYLQMPISDYEIIKLL